MGPVRCSECRAYMNLFMTFIDAGRKFICGFCGAKSDTPHEYIENTDSSGRRRDADLRPELCQGSVEVMAPQQFMVRVC
jgi:protein transport protein SEC24